MEARGDELVAQAGAAQSSVEWFASVDGTPVGPLSTEEIVSRISTGVLEWDAHVWREGYAEWKTVDAADTLVRAVASSRGAFTDERPDSTERTSMPPNDERDDDAFEQDARTMNVEAPTIAALEDSPTRISYDETPTRMYTSGHSAPPGSLQPVARSAFASRPPGSLAPVTRPVISESSPNLMAGSHAPYGSSPSIEVSRAQLTGGALPIPTSYSRPPASAPPVRGGYAGGEGSGLIDIRALASLAQTRMNAPQQARSVAPPTNGHEVDDLEVQDSDPLASFGTGHGVAFAALDSLAPAANREKPKDSTVPLAILTGAAMIAAAAFAALYITRAPTLSPPVAAASQPSAPSAEAEPVAPVAPTAAEPAAAPTEAASPEGAEPPPAEAAEPAAAAEAEEKPAAAGETVAAATPATPAKTARAGKRIAVRKAREANAAPAAAEGEDEEDVAAKTEEKAPPPTVDDILLADDKPSEKAAAEAEKPAPKAAPVDRSIDDLLDIAVTKKGAAPAAAAPPADAAAEAPSRNDVLASMRKIEAEVRACAANEATPVTGTANVAITVSGSTGKVTSAEVTGLTGQVGSCIARVARTATFAPFTREKFSVTYPYRFK